MAYKIVAPTGQKLLVLPLDKKEEKLGSLIIPETANAKLQEGIVEAVGEAVSHLYKQGDKILFTENSGVGYIYKGKAHLWLDGGDEKTQTQIWGIVTKEKD